MLASPGDGRVADGTVHNGHEADTGAVVEPRQRRRREAEPDAARDESDFCFIRRRLGGDSGRDTATRVGGIPIFPPSTRRFRGDDDGLIQELLDAQFGSIGESVRAGKTRDPGLLRHDSCLDVRDVNRRPQECDIHGPGEEPRRRVGEVMLGRLDRDTRKSLIDSVQKLEEKIRAGPDQISDPNVRLIDQLRRSVKRSIYLFKCLLDVWEPFLTHSGQPHRPRVAIEKAFTEDALKLLNRSGQRRLRDVELLGRAPIVEFSPERCEVAQQSQAHIRERAHGDLRLISSAYLIIATSGFRRTVPGNRLEDDSESSDHIKEASMPTTGTTFTLETPARQEFFDVTEQVQELVRESGITDGVVIVYSPHTSCCVLLQEESEDTTYYGTQLLLQDTLNVFAKIAPPTRHEGQYLHPGPVHIRNAADRRGELPEWGLNTDGHIISSILGRSETIPIAGGALVLGEFGRIYFGDLDSVRARSRSVHVQVLGF